MRKTPQLREVLPIYPAMPFPPLARFATPGAIWTVRAGTSRISVLWQWQFREIGRQTGNKMERNYRTNGLDMSPLLRSISIVAGRTRGLT